MKYLKVKDHENLVRNSKTNFIVNTNHTQYEEYIARRDAANKAKENASNMEEDLASLKGEIGEIKSLLKEIANGN